MAFVMDALLTLEFIPVVSIVWTTTVLGARSKRRYIRKHYDVQVENSLENLIEPTIKMRVRCLAVLCTICIIGMAFSLTFFLTVDNTSVLIWAGLIFARIGAAIHFLIDLDTRYK